MYAVAIGVLVLLVGVFIFLLVEVRNWTAGRLYFSRKRFALRIASGVLLVMLLAAIFLALTVFDLARPAGRPVFFLVYWSACTLAALILIILVLLEMHEVRQGEKRREAELWRDIAQTIADNLPKKKR